MTTRLAKYHGAAYCLPSKTEDSLRASVQSAPISDLRSDRSARPPVAAYAGVWVLPTSRTSGGFSSESEVVIFCWMPFHCWVSNFSLAFVFFSKAAVTSLVQPGGVEPSMAQTVRVCPLKPSAPVFPPLSPSSPPHAATETNMPATPIAAMSLRFTSPSSGMPATPLPTA